MIHEKCSTICLSEAKVSLPTPLPLYQLDLGNFRIYPFIHKCSKICLQGIKRLRLVLTFEASFLIIKLFELTLFKTISSLHRPILKPKKLVRVLVVKLIKHFFKFNFSFNDFFKNALIHEIIFRQSCLVPMRPIKRLSEYRI